MKTVTPIRDPRKLAVLCMHEVAQHGLLVPEGLNRIWFELSNEDLNLAHELIYGAFRFYPGLTHVLGRFCKVKKLPPRIFWLLVLSLYQLRYMRVPDYAVLNEANRLAANLKFPGLKGLVNGVLRNVIRRKEVWEELGGDAYLLPGWMRGYFLNQYDAPTLDRWLAAWRERGRLCYWRKSGEGLPGDEPSDVVPHGFRRQNGIDSEALKDGMIYFQNESSQAIAEIICRSGKNSVLDLCAAPGGKVCYVSAFGRQERLVAYDISASRREKLKENRARLALDFALCETKSALARETPFALVLVDAPCSGIGIIGRHPEIKFHRSRPADEKLRISQAQALARGWKLVEEGGHLLLTLCSLDRGEIPEFPRDAVVDEECLGQWLPAGIPGKFYGSVFVIEPTRIFDGFMAVLLKKPKKTTARARGRDRSKNA